jgi:putative OPT family oligopeptide transporter
MADPVISSHSNDTPPHQPYVPDNVTMPEFTWPALVVGALLGIVFGASSLYLVLKVGLTVSASIPVAVLSITLFRAFSRFLPIRRATILENNIVQTTGSAGESIAFGVGVTMPALLLLGHDMSVIRVMTVGVLGGLLGILMMIPLRRAFIVKQHGKLRYPEGTACAEVLIAGEKGGATAKMVFLGFGIAFVHKFLSKACRLWQEEPEISLESAGLKKGVLGGELSPELLGVGYIIGPKIASIMVAGGVLAYLVLVPILAFVGEYTTVPVPPAKSEMKEDKETKKQIDVGLIKNMSVGDLRNNYILYIGAGAVATGGIISMAQALPLILSSLFSGLRDLRSGKGNGKQIANVPRSERDLPMSVVLFGSVGLVCAIAVAPALGLGLSLLGIVGAVLIVLFGFLFVTVSSRLTGEIGSSSNPISGMTVATLLLTCLVFFAMGKTDKAATLTALTVAAVVCIAASNGGTTSQDLKTGYLVGGTPSYQQLAILVGALTSALVIGVTLLLLNDAGTVYSKKGLPTRPIPNFKEKSTHMAKVAGHYAAEDDTSYHVVTLAKNEVKMDGNLPAIPPGKYLVDDQGKIHYLVDPAINGKLKQHDDGSEVPNKFEAPKTRLMAIIIEGILGGTLPWDLILIGALIAVTLELTGVPSLPFAVGVYLPLSASTPIFLGGVVRWAVDKWNRRSEAEAESSPGVLLASGYIAGGTIAAVLIAFFAFAPKSFNEALRLDPFLSTAWNDSVYPALAAFGMLIVILLLVGAEKFFAASKHGKMEN